MNKMAQVALILSSIFVTLSAIPHAFAGWPAMRTAMEEAGVAENYRQAIHMGWSYGTAAMLALGFLLALAWLRIRRGETSYHWVPLIIGVAYLVFGISAYFYRDFNPHFFFFIAPGFLAVLGSRYRRHSS